MRPASLGQEDGLASSNALRLSNSRPVVVLSFVDAVGLSGFEVGETVVAEPVDGGSNASVLRQDPGSPGVDVADGLAL